MSFWFERWPLWHLYTSSCDEDDQPLGISLESLATLLGCRLLYYVSSQTLLLRCIPWNLRPEYQSRGYGTVSLDWWVGYLLELWPWHFSYLSMWLLFLRSFTETWHLHIYLEQEETAGPILDDIKVEYCDGRDTKIFHFEEFGHHSIPSNSSPNQKPWTPYFSTR